jgi:imidazole glycerol phosphate synthase subunit HisF
MEQKDAGNRLLWKQNRRKLEAEEIRDAVLAASIFHEQQFTFSEAKQYLALHGVTVRPV